MTTYSAGSIALATGSAVVTGTGTAWSTNVVAGQFLAVGEQWFQILTVTSDTSVTLATPWNAAAVSGQLYVIQAAPQTGASTGAGVFDAVVLGANGSVGGKITLRGSVSGDASIMASATTGEILFTLPPGTGLPGQVLNTDGTGVLGWASPLRFGVGVPTSAIGNDGEYYLNLTDGSTYGPRASGVWPEIAMGNANALIAGVGAPANTVGNNGQYYQDEATGNIYGPKAAGAWPASPTLTLPDGDVLSMNTAGSAPANTVGRNGDYVLDTSSGNLYGPKGSGVWPLSPVSALGPSVPPGTLLTGSGAPTTATGTNGQYYIDTAAVPRVLYGPKTSGAWPAGVPLSTATISGTITTGTGAPASGVGVDGGYYIDIGATPPNLYGPRASGVWPATSTSLGTGQGIGVGSVIDLGPYAPVLNAAGFYILALASSPSSPLSGQSTAYGGTGEPAPDADCGPLAVLGATQPTITGSQLAANEPGATGDARTASIPAASIWTPVKIIKSDLHQVTWASSTYLTAMYTIRLRRTS